MRESHISSISDDMEESGIGEPAIRDVHILQRGDVKVSPMRLGFATRVELVEALDDCVCLSTRSGPLCSSNLAHPKLLTLIAKKREECSAGVLTKEPLGLCLEH